MSKKKWIIKYDPLAGTGATGPQGPQGPPGSVDLPLSSDDVDYNGQTLTEVLDELLYTPLTINSFSANPSTYEKGQVLTSVALLWTYNKAVESQTITGTDVVSPSLLVGDRNKVVTLSNVAVNTVITLTADDVVADDNAAITRTVTLQFLNKLYWGKGVIPGAVNSAFILALSNSELKSSRTKSFSIDASTGEYIWFALPEAYGLPSFLTNGFNGGFQLHSTISLTNASGHTENYRVYRTTNHSLGLTFVDVE